MVTCGGEYKISVLEVKLELGNNPESAFISYIRSLLELGTYSIRMDHFAVLEGGGVFLTGLTFPAHYRLLLVCSLTANYAYKLASITTRSVGMTLCNLEMKLVLKGF